MSIITGRYSEIDALRGIAATIVMLRHFVNVWPYESMGIFFYIFLRSPLRIFFAAHEAVLLFYLLSGFVLTIALDRMGRDYLDFLNRRLCRIYLPYLFALLLSVWGAIHFYGAIPQLSDWFNLTWTTPVTRNQITNHLLFIGVYPNGELNTAFWTLIYEMRISIIFPAIYWLTRRLDARLALAIALLVSIAVWPFDSNPYQGGLLITLHFAAFFVVGSVMARNIGQLCNLYLGCSRRRKIMLTVLAIGLVTYGAGPPFVKAALGDLTDWFIIAGLGWLIVAGIAEPRIRSGLNSRIPQFLGQISYSLYLVHATVLFALVHLCFGTISLFWLLVPYLGISLCLAWFMYRHIERPAMALGRTMRLKSRTGN